MTNRLELNWKLDGFVDEQRYYCSETPIDTENLPVPKAVFAGDVRTYVDNVVEASKTYFVSVGSVKSSIEKLSKVVAVDTISSLNELLIFADAEDFPSEIFIDFSVKARPVTAVGGIKMINTQAKLYDEGWIYYNNTGVYATANKYLTANLHSALNTSDFTFECFVKPDYAKSTEYSRIFAVGTHGTNGMLSISKSGNPWVLNIDAYNWGWTLSTAVATPPPIPDGQIRHICLMRKAGIFYAFVDGVLSATKSDLLEFSLNQTNVFIGSHPFSNETAFDSFGGFMSSIRLTRFARYSESGFTPPNYKFPR